MATAFPASLPTPMRMGYGYSVEQPHTETMNDRGIARRRRLGIGSTITATLAWRFTQAQLETFAQWWRDDISYGTDDFTISLLNGYTYTAQDVRPKGAYTAARLDGAWDVSLSVEMVAMPVASQSEMQSAIDNFDDLLQAGPFHYLVHVLIPRNLS